MPYQPVFGLVPNPNGPGVMELDPTQCPAGHRWGPRRYTRTSIPCGVHGLHRLWICNECGGQWAHPTRDEQCGEAY